MWEGGETWVFNKIKGEEREAGRGPRRLGCLGMQEVALAEDFGVFRMLLGAWLLKVGAGDLALWVGCLPGVAKVLVGLQ